MNKEIIRKAFEKGIDLTQYIILLKAKNQEDFLTLLSVRRLEGIINLMVKRKYLTDDLVITEKGKLLLEEIGIEEVSIPQANIKIVSSNELPFEAWTSNLLALLKGKLKEIIGKEQIMGFGNVYFMPGIQDLRGKLTDVAKQYNIPLMENKEAIENILLRHVTRCAKLKSFSPAVKYFILKQGAGSQLVTALESYTVKEESEEIKDKIEVKNLKDLF